VLWEDGSTTAAPGESSYREPMPPAVIGSLVVRAASRCVAVALVTSALGFLSKPTKASVGILLAVFGVGIVLMLLPRVPYARARHSQRDLKTIWLALQKLHGERGSWPLGLAAVRHGAPSSAGAQLPSKRRISRYDYRAPEDAAGNEAIAWERDGTHYGRRHVLYEDGTIVLLPVTTGRPRDFDSVVNENREHVTRNGPTKRGPYGTVSEQCAPDRATAIQQTQ